MGGSVFLSDIFISYSSQDRPVAERVRAALVDAGYGVFWDQAIPPGKDWDSWLRDELMGARLVVVLWTKASVASPNVRHEAIIAREAGKLLPVMVDDLGPSDFPMGLFLVQALRIGRTAREFGNARPKFLYEVGARLEQGEPAAQSTSPATVKPRRRAPWLAVAALLVAVLAAAALFLAWPSLSFDPGAPPVTVEALKAAADSEGPARARVAQAGERTMTGDLDDPSSSWTWALAQGIAAAPDENRGLTVRYFQRLATAARPGCNCYYAYDIPLSVGNAWVILASARLRRSVPASLLETVLAAQAPDGWWAISLDATPDRRNAAVHATALMTIALAEARRAGIVPPALATRVDAATGRAVAWLNRGPADGAQWADYPDNERRTPNLAFAAMASVASRLGGGQGDGAAERAFTSAVRDLPAAWENFASGADIERAGGQRYFDDYRHPATPWIGLAATLAYSDADTATKRRLQPLIRRWLETDLTDENLLRHDWVTGETLYLRAIAARALRGGA